MENNSYKYIFLILNLQDALTLYNACNTCVFILQHCSISQSVWGCNKGDLHLRYISTLFSYRAEHRGHEVINRFTPPTSRTPDSRINYRLQTGASNSLVPKHTAGQCVYSRCEELAVSSCRAPVQPAHRRSPTSEFKWAKWMGAPGMGA